MPKVYHTTNLGYSWTAEADGLPDGIPVIELEMDNLGNLYAGTDVGVFSRLANDDEWYEMNDGLPFKKVNDIEINNCSGQIRISTMGRGIWETELIPGTISSNTTWDEDKLIGADLTIKSGKTLTIEGCTIEMAEGKKIVVEQGAQLIIDNAIITKSSCANDLWQGIHVYGKNTENQSSANQGKVIVRNNSSLEYFRDLSSYDGGIIQAENSDFLNVDHAIGFGWYRPDTYSSISYISNCSFLINNYYYNYDDDLRPFITMYGITGIEIDGCEFSNTATIVDYDEKGTGIYTIDASYTVDDCDFTNMYYGIDVRNTDPTFDVSITNSSFSGNTKGIFLSNVHYPIVEGNELSVPEIGGSVKSYGIYSSFCTGYDIDENVIDGTGDDYSTYGIIVNESGTASNKVDDSDLSDLYVGSIAQGINGGTNKGLIYYCNDFQDDFIGLVIGMYDSSKICHVINSEQGCLYFAAMNRFISNDLTDILNTCGNFTYWYINQTYYNPSTTYSDPAPSESNAYNNVNDCTYFKKKSSGDPESELENVEEEIRNIESLLSTYNKDTIEYYKNIPESQIWFLMQDLTYNLQKKGNLINQIIRSYQVDKSNWNKITDLLNKQDDLHYQYQLIDYLISLNEFEKASNKLQSIDPKSLNQIEKEYFGDLNSIYDLKIDLFTDQQDYFEMNEEQKSMLTKISETETKAGIMAKNIRSLISDYTYEEIILDIPSFFENRKSISGSSDEVINSNVKISVFPNPTKGEFELNFDLSDVKFSHAEIEIYDLNGKKYFDVPIVNRIGQVTFSDKDFSSGPYYLIFRLDNRIIFRKVLIKSK